MQPDNAREFSYRYSGTYIGKRSKDGAVLPVHIAEVTPAVVLGAQLSGPTAQFSTTQEYEWDDSFIFEYPTLGNIQVDNQVAFVKRPVTREYKRGYRPRNMRISKVGYYPNRIKTIPPSTAALMVWSIFNNKFETNLNNAGDSIIKGDNLGVALTPSLALGVNRNYNDPVLYCDGNIVGYYKEGVLIIHPVFDYIAEELNFLGMETEVYNA